MAAGGSGELTNDNRKLVKEFAMAACQERAGNNNRDSALVLKVEVAHSNTKEFARWQQQRLDYTFRPAAPTPPQKNASTPLALQNAYAMPHSADPSALIAMMANAMGVRMGEASKLFVSAATKQTEVTIQQKVELGKGKQYSGVEVAWITGWACVEEINDVLRIWGKFMETKNVQLHHAQFSTGMLNVETFKKGLATYTALNYMLLGEQCDFYQSLLAVRQTMDTQAGEQLRGFFWPSVLTQYTWAVMDDTRSPPPTKVDDRGMDEAGTQGISEVFSDGDLA